MIYYSSMYHAAMIDKYEILLEAADRGTYKYQFLSDQLHYHRLMYNTLSN